MCGVAGLIASQKTEYDSILRNMIDTIKHRGPDDNGFYSDDHIGLGQARLSIIDPENGKQPATNEDESLVVIFNGEIFNFQELKKQLLNQGHILTNNSDTEILPHMYEEYGLSMFSKLDGQFAIAVWDKSRCKLVLARDRFGEKPLYYYHQGSIFCFASEAKAILKSGLISAALSPLALKQVFSFWTTLGDLSIFENIYQVPAGSCLIFKDNVIRFQPYWEFSYSTPAAIGTMNENEYVGQLESRLLSAIKGRMIADVPISFYLSGGLDSSLVASMAAQLSNTNLNTFSITFDDSGYDESKHQAEMSRYLGSNHHSIAFSSRQIPLLVRDVVYHSEMPLLRSGAFPMYALARLVNRHGIKVVLSGEGADELFAGYDIFREVKIREFCSRDPESQARPLLYKRINNYVKGLAEQNAAHLAHYYNRIDPGARFSSHLLRWGIGAFSQQFFAPDYRRAMNEYDELGALESSLPQDYWKWTPLQQAQYLEVTTLFSNYLLSSQGDRVSMAASVECRYPFLDHEVAELAASMPDSLKIKGLNEKYLVKQLGEKYLPDSIVKRHKFPYRAPIDIAELMQDEYIRHIISTTALKGLGVFNAEAVERFLSSLLRKYLPTERDAMLFMGIVTTQVLGECFIK